MKGLLTTKGLEIKIKYIERCQRMKVYSTESLTIGETIDILVIVERECVMRKE